MHVLVYLTAILSLIGGFVGFAKSQPDVTVQHLNPALYQAQYALAYWWLVGGILSAVLLGTFGRISQLLEIPVKRAPELRKEQKIQSQHGVTKSEMIRNENGTFTIGNKTFKTRDTANDYVDHMQRLSRMQSSGQRWSWRCRVEYQRHKSSVKACN